MAIPATSTGPILPVTANPVPWAVGIGALGFGLASGLALAVVPLKLAPKNAIAFAGVALLGAALGALAGNHMAGNPGVAVDPKDFGRLTPEAQAAARAQGFDPAADAHAWVNQVFAAYDRNTDNVIDLKRQNAAFETEAVRDTSTGTVSNLQLFTSADRLGDRNGLVTRAELSHLIDSLKPSDINSPTLNRPEGRYVFPANSFSVGRAILRATTENPEVNS